MSSSPFCNFNGSENFIPEFDLPFLSDNLPHFSESDIQLLHALIEDPVQQNPILFNDENSPILLPSSPPSIQFENPSLLQSNSSNTHVSPSTKVQNFQNGFADYSALISFGVKAEEGKLSFGPFGYNYNLSVLHNKGHGNPGAGTSLMQRSYDSNSFEAKPDFFFQTCFDAQTADPNSYIRTMNPNENILSAQTVAPNPFTPLIYPNRNLISAPHVGMICYTEDIQNNMPKAPAHGLVLRSSTPIFDHSEKYGAEEKRERIQKFKDKRTQRNFNKRIKVEYTCRKTLADKRPRIHGRFVRKWEQGEIPKATCFRPVGEGDELLIGELHGEYGEGAGSSGGSLMNSDGGNQFQYNRLPMFAGEEELS